MKLALIVALAATSIFAGPARTQNFDLTSLAQTTAHFIAASSACGKDWQRSYASIRSDIEKRWAKETLEQFTQFVELEVARATHSKCDQKSYDEWYDVFRSRQRDLMLEVYKIR